MTYNISSLLVFRWCICLFLGLEDILDDFSWVIFVFLESEAYHLRYPSDYYYLAYKATPHCFLVLT